MKLMKSHYFAWIYMKNMLCFGKIVSHPNKG